MSQLFASGGQSIGVSSSTSVLPIRVDWVDLLAVQGTLESLLQHHNLTASILFCPAFFMVQLSHPYMTTGKTIALTAAAAAAAKSLQSCLTLCDPTDGSHQASPSLGFSRQEYWSGVPHSLD